ncbi:MAG: YqhA family protein [Hydrogenobacter thermophilus]|uniref:YqhA family protein n=1 Tax=Hydrogenobacter thermophilus TaxID=940 RepID=UPI001C73E5D7|nr:YqhA family protein [Hydrogenobacter thermophilus]QWK19670.1 MAG: YqhA family protein [Hydrogenobacter thermophilus]
MIRKLLELGQAIAFLPAISLFLGATFLALYGVYILLETIYSVVFKPEVRDPAVLSTKFISVMDIHLLSIVLYIFSVGLYELFVGKLNVPDWLRITNIDQLKAKLASVIVLILAITFTKKIVEWKDPLDTFLFALAIAAIVAVLIFYYKVKEE